MNIASKQYIYFGRNSSLQNHFIAYGVDRLIVQQYLSGTATLFEKFGEECLIDCGIARQCLIDIREIFCPRAVSAASAKEWDWLPGKKRFSLHEIEAASVWSRR